MTIIDLIPNAMVNRFAQRLAVSTIDGVPRLRSTMIEDFVGLVDQQTGASLTIRERDELVKDACKETTRRTRLLLLERIEHVQRLFDQGASDASKDAG